MRQAIGYIRVSTGRQASEGESLAAQRAKLTAHCAAVGLELVHIYADEGVSGGLIDNRPGVQAALNDACRRRCALVVVSLSRLIRSVTGAISIGDRISRHGADLISLSENIDTTTASGRLVFRLLALLGEFEKELVSERTTATLSHLRAAGRRISGRLPYGWRLSANGSDLERDPTEQVIVDRCHAMRASGSSFNAIALALTHEGVPSKCGVGRWLPKTVAAIVRRGDVIGSAAA
ncbi:MAG: recombinase family protein [Planctomycetota bacterium]